MATVEVPPDRAGERLDRFLSTHPEIGSRTRAERLIEAGEVLVDGAARPKRHRLTAGARVEFPEPAQTQATVEAVPMELEVPYRDEWLLVVDKPAGLVVHPAPGTRDPTLAHGLVGEVSGDGARPGIVHRLDRDTSGLLVVARDDKTLGRLQGMLRRRRIHRTYLALVRGRPPSRRGTIEAAIGRDRRDPTRISLDTASPRDAVTHFTLAEALPGRTLLEVELETGRTHQIRVHLAAIGHPVCGDRIYGHGEELGLTRQFLHASRLRFAHPVTGDEVDVSSPLPPDLESALDAARLAG